MEVGGKSITSQELPAAQTQTKVRVSLADMGDKIVCIANTAELSGTQLGEVEAAFINLARQFTGKPILVRLTTLPIE